MNNPYFKKVDLFPLWKPFAVNNKNLKKNSPSTATIKLSHPGKFELIKINFIYHS